MSKNNEDDILIEDIKDKPTIEAELQELKEETRERNSHLPPEKERYDSEEDLKRLISSYEPPEITDWPKIPYKTIFVILLLLFGSILFLFTSAGKYKEGKPWKEWLPHGILGGMLIIPGLYYSFFLLNILMGRRGYTYDLLPDLSEGM